MQADTPHVKIERAGTVLCVGFDRPEKKNALNGAMYLAATGALQAAETDSSIGAIAFAGTAGAFTAGNDLGDFLDADGGHGDLPAFTFIKALARSEMPLVAAIARSRVQRHGRGRVLLWPSPL